MAVTDNTRGALLMVVAMASFTVNDALIKAVTPYINVGQIMFVRGVITFTLVYFIARHMGALRPIKSLLHPAVIMRCLCEVAATILFLTGLSMLNFANVAAIMQSLPLVVTLGAALFLGNKVGWRRWLAIMIGFSGVIIIIRPGQDGFTIASLFLVATVFVTAGRDLFTRKMPSNIPSLTVTLLTTAVNATFGAALIIPLGGWQPLDWTIIAYLSIAAIMVLSGYQSIIMAMRVGEIAFVAPFRYTSLVFAFFISVTFFNETIDTWTIVGAIIVICSGLYTFYRESRKSPIQMAETTTRVN